MIQDKAAQNNPERIGCGQVSLDLVGKKITLAGWVHRRRDHGGVIFIDLRDRSGLVQVVFNPQEAPDIFRVAERLRSEYVIKVIGEVRRRPEGSANPNLVTGEVEVYADQLEVLNPAKTPPFEIADYREVDEALRLKYRYLDLRRPEMQSKIIARHRITKAVRDYLDKQGFLEIETPVLTRSTPEGARDYLVPSRVHQGSFYALPQSPQLFKQILMVSGFEKYFQIVKCFRDEDLRADRQPEFTQIDIEMSFVEPEDVQRLAEGMLAYAYKEVFGKDLPVPFPRMTWAEAMDRYGTDRPDLRFGLELINFTDLVKDSQFKVFAKVAQAGGEVKGINAKGGSVLSRRELDGLTEFVGEFGAKGLAWMVIGENEIKSPITKFFTAEELDSILERAQAEPGDLLLFVADEPQVVAASLGNLRLKLAGRLGLISETSEDRYVWITDFPMFEYSEEEGRYVALHHPFTSPKEEDLKLLGSDLSAVKAKAYDLVLNGLELGGGSIRIHRPEVQQQVFEALKVSPEEAADKFGFLLDGLSYGAPPHGGIAFGLDRLVMLWTGSESIREVIAFPKTQSAMDLMVKAPAPVEKKQLDELGIELADFRE
ncbi:MAG: aspartate--tRNA ligase [Firmicutes bacterium]|nr:aspartate--tRNA ligase [Bacillota bacterium]